MIANTIARQGNWFFRWRSYVLLGFIPLGIYALSFPEPIETLFGATADSAWEMGCILIAFLGLGIRAMVVGQTPAGTSGRNTHGQVAEVLNTTGLYSVTRNPLYLGNAIIYVINGRQALLPYPLPKIKPCANAITINTLRCNAFITCHVKSKANL